MQPHKSSGEKLRPVLSSRGPGPDVGALGDIEDARDCPEKTPILLRLAGGARGACAKLNAPGWSMMARNDARRRDDYFLSLAQRVSKKMPVPCRRRMRRFAGCFVGCLEASPPVADDAPKKAGRVADLEARRNHGEFEKRAQQTMFVIGGTGKNDCEGHRARRNKHPNREKPSENRPQQHTPYCKDGHAMSPRWRYCLCRCNWNLLPDINRASLSSSLTLRAAVTNSERRSAQNSSSRSFICEKSYANI